jgi:NADH dehydrogenase FAD-containing subunit
MRLTQPPAWKQDYLMPFSRYKKLRRVRTLQGLIKAINPETDSVTVRLHDGTEQVEHYDALVISSGVSNGFWRNNTLEDTYAINQNMDRAS